MPVTTKLSLTTIGYVMLFVKDTEKSLPFYRDTLGIPVKFYDKGWVELDVKGFTLALHQTDEVPSHGSTSPVLVFSVEDVRGTYNALRELGLAVKDLHQVHEEDGKVGLSADFTDPDGHSLSIFGFVPQSEWADKK